MHSALYTVDAFTCQPFAGNPAAVCVSSAPLDEAWMRLLAREMNLSETAFVYPVEGGFSLRWLTPVAEVKLCGHATLASAAVLWDSGRLRRGQPANFQTLSGWITCHQEEDWIVMDFPAVEPVSCTEPDGLAAALGCDLLAIRRNHMDFLIEVQDEVVLRSLQPDFAALSKLPVRGVIVTCRGASKSWDFMSRFFAPAVGVNEDPVTGSAHCALGPYWGEKLGKKELTAFQASERGGVVKMELRSGRVLLSGQAVLMSEMTLRHWPLPGV